MSDETYFIKNNKNNIIPNENIKYKCRVLMQIQSVYHNMKNKDIRYYPQVLIEQRVYKTFSSNTRIDPDLKFADSEPDCVESEEEINENSV